MTGKPRWVQKPHHRHAGCYSSVVSNWLRNIYIYITFFKLKLESCALLTLLYFQTLMTFENGKLVQKQTWDGKTTTLERELQDGKLIAVRFSLYCFSHLCLVGYKICAFDTSILEYVHGLILQYCSMLHVVIIMQYTLSSISCKLRSPGVPARMARVFTRERVQNAI